MVQRNDGGALKALLWIIGLVGFLVYLTMGGGPSNYPSGERNKTVASLAAIKSGLEQYHEKFGYYPEPAGEAQSDRGTFDEVTMNCGGAAMLYQVISGDGSDYVKADSKGVPSDGMLDEQEVANSINPNLPPHVIFTASKSKGTPGPRYLVDGYGRPFQYTKGGHVEAVNSTYDVWSYGDVKTATVSWDVATKKDTQKTATWIKNW